MHSFFLQNMVPKRQCQFCENSVADLGRHYRLYHRFSREASRRVLSEVRHSTKKRKKTDDDVSDVESGKDILRCPDCQKKVQWLHKHVYRNHSDLSKRERMELVKRAKQNIYHEEMRPRRKKAKHTKNDNKEESKGTFISFLNKQVIIQRHMVTPCSNTSHELYILQNTIDNAVFTFYILLYSFLQKRQNQRQRPAKTTLTIS